MLTRRKLSISRRCADFDAAAVALEAGAREVHLFARRDALASLPVIRIRGYPGAYDNYGSLPDAVRWHHRPPGQDNPRLKAFIEVFKSPEVKQFIEENIPAFIPAGFNS